MSESFRIILAGACGAAIGALLLLLAATLSDHKMILYFAANPASTLALPGVLGAVAGATLAAIRG